MIYLGHFSFKSGDQEERQASDTWHGYFTYLAEAESVEKALQKFHTQIRRIARTADVFSGVAKVYLDSCIEIKSIRKSGFLAYYEEMRGECREAISTSLVGVVKNNDLVAYQFTGEDCSDDTDPDADEALPFVVFNQ
jgi:hypothetical protein